MAPEREISDEQLTKVESWISGKAVLVESTCGSRESRTWVDFENQEPLVIFKDNPPRFSTRKGNMLSCSEKHAKELEEAGIVNFSTTEVTER